MLELLFVLLLTCSVHLAVNAAPVDVEESGPWCDLTDTRVNASGRMVCRFNDEVENVQLDFYAQNGAGTPDIVVTCFTQCEVADNFQDILDLKDLQEARTLSLSLLTLSPRAVGRYRCQASSVSTKHNVAGNCSFQLSNIKVGFGQSDDSDDTTPSEEEVGYTYFFFLLLIIVVVAVVAIPLVICKKKACGLWKTQENVESDTEKDQSVRLRASPVGESSSPTKHREHVEDNEGNEERDLTGDYNENADDEDPLTREDEDPLTREDDPEYDQPSDTDSGGDDHGTNEGLKVPMMEKVRTEFAATHSPATCKKRTMLRHELHRMFEEEKKRSVKK